MVKAARNYREQFACNTQLEGMHYNTTATPINAIVTWHHSTDVIKPTSFIIQCLECIECPFTIQHSQQLCQPSQYNLLCITSLIAMCRIVTPPIFFTIDHLLTKVSSFFYHLPQGVINPISFRNISLAYRFLQGVIHGFIEMINRQLM